MGLNACFYYGHDYQDVHAILKAKIVARQLCNHIINIFPIHTLYVLVIGW